MFHFTFLHHFNIQPYPAIPQQQCRWIYLQTQKSCDGHRYSRQIFVKTVYFIQPKPSRLNGYILYLTMPFDTKKVSKRFKELFRILTKLSKQATCISRNRSFSCTLLVRSMILLVSSKSSSIRLVQENKKVTPSTESR